MEIKKNIGFNRFNKILRIILFDTSVFSELKYTKSTFLFIKFFKSLFAPKFFLFVKITTLISLNASVLIKLLRRVSVPPLCSPSQNIPILLIFFLALFSLKSLIFHYFNKFWVFFAKYFCNIT